MATSPESDLDEERRELLKKLAAVGLGAAAGSLLGSRVSVPRETAVPAGTISASMEEFFSVKSYGAVGDGVANDAGAIQAAINATPSAGGTVYFPAGTYKVNAGLTVAVGKPVMFHLEPGAVIRAGAAITMLTFDRVNANRRFGVIGGQFDMNQLATRGILMQDTWFSHVDTQVVNVGAGKGLVYLSSRDAFLSLYNEAHVDIRGNNRTAGSIGVSIETTAPSGGRSNFNRVSGRCGGLDKGIGLIGGDACVFDHLDATDNNIGYDISGFGHVLLACWAEVNGPPPPNGPTDGVVVRTGADLKVIASYIDAIRTEGTGKLLLIDNNGNLAFRTFTPNDTPLIQFIEQGDSSISLRYRSSGLILRDTDTPADRLVFGRTGYIDMLRTTAPPNPPSDRGRIYVRAIDSMNDGVFVRIMSNGLVTERRLD